MFAEYLRSQWSNVRAGLLEVIGKFEDADLGFRPFAGSWTLAELILHIAQEERGEVQCGLTREIDAWPDAYSPPDYPTLDSIKLILAEVHAVTAALTERLDDEALAHTVETPWGTKNTMLALLNHVVEHEIHHRAELSLILGLLGRQGLDA
jgi:uncharacterized damage-inducible protein DinB